MGGSYKVRHGHRFWYFREEVSLLEEIMESPIRCSSDIESINHMDSAVVVVEAIPSPVHRESSNENERLCEDKLEPAGLETWDEEFKIFQQVFPPATTSRLQATSELFQLLSKLLLRNFIGAIRAMQDGDL